jgi:membrane protein
VKYLALFRDAWSHWREDKCSRLGAALAYYAIFSIAPLLIIFFGVIGIIFGNDSHQALMAEIQRFVGPTAGRALSATIKASALHGGGLWPTLVGTVTLIIGAGGMFAALQDALNTIWGVAPDPKAGWGIVIRNRLVSFLMILVAGAVLFASLAASAVIQAIGTSMQGVLPLPGWALETANFGVSLALITVLFALVYRVLPDAEIAWSDVWVGAAFTAVLFVGGKFALGLYLGRSTVGSAYGAAGSLVVLLVWVYYAAQIFLFGAEYTQAYANRYGSHVKAAEHAVPVAPESLSEEGIPPQPVYREASEAMAERRGYSDREGVRQRGAPELRAGSRETKKKAARSADDESYSSGKEAAGREGNRSPGQPPAGRKAKTPQPREGGSGHRASVGYIHDASRHIRGDI